MDRPPGISMATSIASALVGLKADPNLAMTGEITRPGKCLPIGGLKEKVLGRNARVSARFCLPKRNEPDLEDIPKEIRDSMTFVAVEELSKFLQQALGKRIIAPVPLGGEANKASSNVVPMRRRATAIKRNGERKRRAPVAGARKR